ncbi:hypothetical protein WKI65_17770 [Streptomyces sp. MS1.AVA.3]|uniref:hypothetical protein n=1 Tax=Streptomyces decoyicus TaxID=249567 RepID=UPI0030C1D541
MRAFPTALRASSSRGPRPRLARWCSDGSADGCLGPLNTLGSSCHWRPDDFWPLTELLLPLVLGLGIFVSAVSALLRSAARRARQLPRRPVEKPAVRAQSTEPGRGGLAARRLWVAAVCLAVVALSTVTSLPSGARPPARTSLTKEQLVPSSAIPTASPQVVGLQTDAWLRLGGRDLRRRFAGELLRLITALQDKSALTDRRSAATRVRPHCLAVEHLAAEARTYSPLPDPRPQQRWAKLQAQGKRAGSDCDRAITDGKFTVFTKAMNTFVTMARTMTDLLDTIGTAAAHAGNTR